MAKNTPLDVQQALADVRRSYRTLYTYQRMVLDLGRYVGQRLSLQYGGGWSKFSNTSPRGGKGSFDNWAWDWLNMYFYEFYFSLPLKGDSELGFSVFIVSDTGYWDSPVDAISQCDVESFAAVESSKTKVLLMAALSVAWDPDSLIRDDAWMKALLNSPGPIVAQKENGVVVTQAFDIHQFTNAEMTDQRLAEFIAHSQQHGVPVPSLSSAL